MASREEVYQAILNADKAGDGDSVRALGAYLKSMPQESAARTAIAAKIAADPISQGAANFAQDMPWYQKAAAGYGKAIPDIFKGVGQRLGLIDQTTVDESKRLDAPLMRTGAGMTGNIGGNIAAMIPAVVVPGAAGFKGATAIGSAFGLMQPTSSTEKTNILGRDIPQPLVNALEGGAMGAGSVAAGRAIAGLWQGGKALAEPLTEAGRQRIAGRTLVRFADDPSKIAQATNQPTVTGALPTLAEQTGDSGLARLQDSLMTDPDFGKLIGQRLKDNNAARVNSLQGLAGDSAQRTAADSARQAASKPLYDVAKAASIEVDPQLAELLKRPSVQSALGRAANYAKEQGRTFGLSTSKDVPASAVLDASGQPMAAGYTIPGKVTGQTLHDLKMGMDALLKDPTSGIAGAEAGAVRDTRAKLLQWLESKVPEYGQARTTYAVKSKPLNGMDVGETIASRALSNTSNLAGDQRMQANALMGMLRDEPALVQRAIGKKGVNALSDVFEPDQLNMLRNVASETDRAAAVATEGNGPGSATARRLASQNVLQQLIGPTGLPKSWGESVMANTVLGKPLNLFYSGVAEPKIQEALARAVLNPQEAQAALAAAQQQGVKLPPNLLMRLAAQARRSLSPSSAQASRQP